MPDSKRHIWLLGLSGSGKSTVGPPLAKMLGLPWVDTDSRITLQAGKTVTEIFQQEGEEGFRKREASALADIAAGPASVISCGGGVVTQETNRKTMASTGIRVYLRADPLTLAHRLRSSRERPLLTGEARETVLSQQLAARAPWYGESEIQVDVSHLGAEEVVATIRKKLALPWSR